VQERPKPPEREAFKDESPSGFKMPSGAMLYVIVLGIIFGVSYLVNMMFGVQKSGWDAKVAGINSTISTMQAEVKSAKDSIATAVNNMPSTIETKVTSALSSYSQRITTLENNVQSAKGQAESVANRLNQEIPPLKEATNDLTSTVNKNKEAVDAKITALETQIVSLNNRIAALETPATSGGDTSIPNFSIEVKVTDDGTIRPSDNATLGEIKLVLTNSGTKDITDLTLYLTVLFDNAAGANQEIVSASYGTWSFREKFRDEVQLKGRMTKIAKGETRRIYIVLSSLANDYQHGRTTFIETSNQDVDIIDWN
jgi:chaperonin cofactor prefoldin